MLMVVVVARLRRLTKVVTGRYLACFRTFWRKLIKPVVLVSARTGSARAPIAEPSDPTRVARGVSRRRTREPRTRRAPSVAIAT